MKDNLQVESVTETDEGITVGITAYRNVKPPITIVFEQKWGGKIRYVRTICRTDKVRPGVSHSSTGWRIHAEVLAKIVIKGRMARRRKRLLQETQPRLFD